MGALQEGCERPTNRKGKSMTKVKERPRDRTPHVPTGKTRTSVLRSLSLSALSLRARLVVLSTALFALLTFGLAAVLPARMNRISHDWAARRATGMAQVLANSAAAGLEFDDPADVEKTLRALAVLPDALFATVRRSGGKVFAGYHAERAVESGLVMGAAPVVAERDGRLHVLAPIQTKGAGIGFLEIAFSLAALRAEERSNLVALGLGALLVLVAGAGGAFFIGTLLSRPLAWLARVAGSIAQGIENGDLRAADRALGGAEQVRARADLFRLGAAGGSEVDQLAGAFASLLKALRDTSVTLKKAAGMLGDSVVQLTASAKQQGESITVQAGALQETQVTAQQLKQTWIAASERAQAVLEVADRADKVGRSGEASIIQTLRGLSEIRVHVDGIAGKMTELNERTQQIGRITETVKDLADQSNMLALNAAIEAVRSGEHGKGFAVVAREIRALADQSIQATTRVREVLTDVNSAIRAAVQISEAGASRMEVELTQVKSSGEDLRELSAIVAGSSEAVRQIAKTVGQQGVGIGQIFAAMTDLSRMMDTTVKGLEQTNESISTVEDVSQRVANVAHRFQL
jgi:methyl-accepting chemotaxis protein